MPSRISSKAYLPTAKFYLLQSIKPWVMYIRKTTLVILAKDKLTDM